MAVGQLRAVAGRNNVVSLGRPDGPVLLFAHGFGCDQNMWRRVLPAFTGHCRVVLLDHVGAGRSDLAAYDPARYASLTGYAQDLLEVCDVLDLQQVTLVGHSVGAMMAVAAAAAEPGRFARLVLVSPSPCYIDDASDAYVGGFSRDDIDGLLASLDSNYFSWAQLMAPVVMGSDHPELGAELAASFCRTDPDIAREFARVTFLSDVRPLLEQVQAPALVLQAAGDALAPAAVGRYLHAQLAGSTLVQLAATGHCPHVSAPQEVAQAILRFLPASR